MSSSNDANEFGGVIFSDVGVSSPDASTIRNTVTVPAFKRIYTDALDTRASTHAGQIIDFDTAVIFDKNGQIIFLANNFNPETASGIWQDALGKIYFIDRLQATFSLAYVDLIGREGLFLPADETQFIDELNQIWILNSEITLGREGYQGAEVRAQFPGTVVARANTINRIYRGPSSGLDIVNNPEDAVVGSDTESRIAYERRRREGVAKNGQGTRSAVWGALANLPNVIAVAVEENYYSYPVYKSGVWLGPHSLFCSVLGGNSYDIAHTIYAKKDAGCDLMGTTLYWIEIPTEDGALTTTKHPIHWQRPGILPYRVRVDVHIGDMDGGPSLAALIKQRVYDTAAGIYDGRRYRMGDRVYASRFYCAVQSLAIANNFDLVQIQVERTESAIAAYDPAFEYRTELNAITFKPIGPDLQHPFFEYAEVNGEVGLRIREIPRPELSDSFFNFNTLLRGIQFRSDIGNPGEPMGWVDWFDTTLYEFPSLSMDDIIIRFV